MDMGSRSATTNHMREHVRRSGTLQSETSVNSQFFSDQLATLRVRIRYMGWTPRLGSRGADPIIPTSQDSQLRSRRQMAVRGFPLFHAVHALWLSPDECPPCSAFAELSPCACSLLRRSRSLQCVCPQHLLANLTHVPRHPGPSGARRAPPSGLPSVPARPALCGVGVGLGFGLQTHLCGRGRAGTRGRRIPPPRRPRHTARAGSGPAAHAPRPCPRDPPHHAPPRHAPPRHAPRRPPRHAPPCHAPPRHAPPRHAPPPPSACRPCCARRAAGSARALAVWRQLSRLGEGSQLSRPVQALGPSASWAPHPP
eukprot:scaffold5637_cov45-Phaeocystis_antarctica.AAC.2